MTNRMQSKNHLTRSMLNLGLCALLAIGFVSISNAQQKKADATGTWTWTMPGRNGGPDRKMTLKLKAEGDKLTGKLVSPGRQGGDPVETEIKEGKVKDGEVSFTVTREFNGNTMTSKYAGKVTAESIKGKIEFERNGEKQSRDWEAKKEAEKK
jgi:hypothetical protein